MPINKMEGFPHPGYSLRRERRAMKDRKERNSTAEDIMKYHDDVASEEIIRETERHFKKLIEALKKA
jgi:hypothetical protein